jgi:NhaP-type Na+/H+ or K+/H+ antiporter
LAVASFLEIPEQSWLTFAIKLIVVGIVIGIIVGALGGWLVSITIKRGWMTGKYQWIGFLALALIAWIAAEGLGGSGFIAAFVGGLTIAASGREVSEAVRTFTEVEGEILNLAVFFIFGLVAITLLSGITGIVIFYAILSLTIIRLIPVAISLIGTKLNVKTKLFIGWFGPRGLASIVLLLIIFDEAPMMPGLGIVQMVIAATVLLSVFTHGISATPLIDWYSKQWNPFPPMHLRGRRWSLNLLER